MASGSLKKDINEPLSKATQPTLMGLPLIILGALVVAGHRFLAWGLAAMYSSDEVDEKTMQLMRRFFIGMGAAVIFAGIFGTLLLD